MTQIALVATLEEDERAPVAVVALLSAERFANVFDLETAVQSPAQSPARCSRLHPKPWTGRKFILTSPRATFGDP